ncbi:MAG: PBSX family phage terminase large subunit [Negativicoccus succinicivorans]|uniref:PBSX family phage terminase large subunit n=1 Tax=Negativicoccus succinicivorans TaxID=620903 RepID=UPI00235434C5|nr:PBSX family phage terminase large subunit [Negativicoccus succinicivorans]MBS5890651.1 PBSX family phage terminase large subunit [Negativicoccus succinicivorans]
MNERRVYLPDVVGKGYGAFWKWRGRYRVVKGSRASKKSKTTALWYIYNLMKHPAANLVVVRKVFRTLQNSCFSDLCWAIDRLGVSPYWKATKSPLEIVYIPTGQKILFVGLDDPLKITSLSVPRGVLCWAWIEEAYEVTSEEAFNRLDESIRGQLPKDLFTQLTLTFNPWSSRHWLKKRFFDEESPQVLALTTDYRCNEFLSASDLALFEEMKKNKKRYRVAGLGDWGIVEGLIYDNWIEKAFDIDALRKQEGINAAFGLDFGFTTDPAALWCGLVDKGKRLIYVFDELYEKGLTNQELYKAIEARGYAKEQITADSAEPKSIEELRRAGLTRVRKSRKGPDSIRHGIQQIQNFQIIVHPRCVNTLRELSLYAWAKDKFDEYTGKPEDDNNHLMDAMRYALAGALGKELVGFGG